MDEFIGRPGLVRKRARSILVTWFAITALLIMFGSVMALLSYNAIQSIKTRNALLDCTQVTGKCHQESEDATARAIKRLLDTGGENHQLTRLVVLYAAACADIPGDQTERQIERCVNNRLRDDNRKVPSP
jgi:hypothetical protein